MEKNSVTGQVSPVRESGIEFSIIIPAKNEGSNVKLTVESLVNASGSIPCEIIVIDDNSVDDSCSFITDDQKHWRAGGVQLFRTAGLGAANARNFGASQASGRILVFSDAHVVVEQGWIEKMTETMVRPEVDILVPGIADYTNPDAVGYGQTWDDKLEIVWLTKPTDVVQVPLAPGGFVAVKRDVFQDVGGFETGFKIWGYEDVEFSLKCWLFGYRAYTTPEVIVKHIFRRKHSYYVSQNEVFYNLMRMAVSHFKTERLAKTLVKIKTLPNYQEIMAAIDASDAWQQRTAYFNRRKYNDDWFMSRFKIPY